MDVKVVVGLSDAESCYNVNDSLLARHLVQTTPFIYMQVDGAYAVNKEQIADLAIYWCFTGHEVTDSFRAL